MRSKGIRHSHRLVVPKPGTIKRSAADKLRERQQQRPEAAERMRRVVAANTRAGSLTSK